MKVVKCIWCHNKENLAFGVCKVCREKARINIKRYKYQGIKRKRKKKIKGIKKKVKKGLKATTLPSCFETWKSRGDGYISKPCSNCSSQKDCKLKV